MSDEKMPQPVATTDNDMDGLQLSGRERRLISNYRAMKASAQEMLFALSEQYRCTLPAPQAVSG
jgi:hypothetical protein